MNEIKNGVWPVMITPFTADNQIDYPAVKAIIDFYAENGCAGVFAVCQSSEMFFLSKEERLALAKCCIDYCHEKGLGVVVSGHVAPAVEDQIIEAQAIIDMGADSYVFISNQFASPEESEEVVKERITYLLDHIKGDSFGIYECPLPWKRLVSLDFLKTVAPEGRMVFLKDTCCDYELIRERLKAVEGTPLKIFNANAQSWFDSYCHGGAGYNGVMANFHPDLYKWCYDHKDSDPEKARLVADFLTTAAMIEMRVYPCSAKYYHSLVGVPMSTFARSKDNAGLDKNARGEVESLINVEKYLREKLGIN